MVRWWIAWRSLICRLFFLFSSVASIGGMFISLRPTPTTLPWWGIALLVVAVIFVVVLVVFELHDHKYCHVFAKTDTEGINRYMHHWIKYGSLVAIWTRDMSWANSGTTKELLMQKARDGELILCMPSPTELTDELTENGAEGCYYGAERHETPSSRFTITNFGRDGSAVAVGRTVGRTHVIEEFSAGAHPAYHIAADLVALVRSSQAQVR
ncbi:MAG: hypothetical protein OXF11_17770 [Deltaproteobacteria bacterium]|nr:hypothetical protein [Deltaproteobacteria bacterium]